MKCLNALEEEILGSSFYDWIFEKDYHDFEKHLQNPIKMDFEMKTKSNEKIVMEFTTHSLKLQDYAEVIQIIAKDVTEVRKSRRALEEMNAVLARLSSVDEMTGLKNYRSFKEELQKIHEDSMKNMRSYSIVFIDVDHFKHYNDRNGHPAGDAVLRKVGELLKKSVRTQDFVARYGGEEFVALLPNTVSEDAKKIAQNILDTIRAEKFPYGEFQPLGLVTASLGVASFPEHGTSSDFVLKAADEAVYFSKKSGRNRVSVYSKLNPQKKAA
jgi:diguanylate cyclase (GGDEF)-like protein